MLKGKDFIAIDGIFLFRGHIFDFSPLTWGPWNQVQCQHMRGVFLVYNCSFCFSGICWWPGWAGPESLPPGGDEKIPLIDRKYTIVIGRAWRSTIVPPSIIIFWCPGLMQLHKLRWHADARGTLVLWETANPLHIQVTSKFSWVFFVVVVFFYKFFVPVWPMECCESMLSLDVHC